MVSAPDHPVTASAPEPTLAERTFPRGFKVTAAGLLAGYVVLTGIWVGLGLLVTGPFAGSGLTDLDQDVATWFVEGRTPSWDDWSLIGSNLADTLPKIIVTAVIAVAMLVAWRSWREPLVISLALILEASVFITTTWIVGRPRPDVEPLDTSPVSSSFPSGHAAAAMAYGAIAVVIFERTRNVWIRTIVAIVTVALPIIVGLARMYRGMHYLTDVVAGIVLGAACVIVVVVLFRRSQATPDATR